MTDPVLAALKAARGLIADPARWTKGVSARNANGVAVPPISTDACRWCTVGALDRVRANDATRVALSLALPTYHHSLIMYNDITTRTHADILALFDRAIERTQESK